MLYDTSVSSEMRAPLKTEKCKPDYEGMVSKLRIRRNKVRLFKNAALSYFEGMGACGKMAELIGELVTEHAMLENKLESLIEQQEAVEK